MGLFSWIFYMIMGIIFFIIIALINQKYGVTKLQKLIISIILMMVTSGACFRLALNYTDDIFLIFVFMMIVDIIYSSYFVEKDFFDKNEKNIEYYIILIILGFIVNQEFINDVYEVFLTGDDLRIILWFLSFIFIYNFVKEKNILSGTTNEVKYMSSQAVLVSYAKLKHKFYDECSHEDKELSNIVYAIMILKNSKRSKVLRNFDYFMFRLNGNERKLGIMQIESKSFITDSESIQLTFKEIEKIINKGKSKTNKSTSNKASKIKALDIIDSYCGEDADYVKYIFDIIKKF